MADHRHGDGQGLFFGHQAAGHHHDERLQEQLLHGLAHAPQQLDEGALRDAVDPGHRQLSHPAARVRGEEQDVDAEGKGRHEAAFAHQIAEHEVDHHQDEGLGVEQQPSGPAGFQAVLVVQRRRALSLAQALRAAADVVGQGLGDAALLPGGDGLVVAGGGVQHVLIEAGAHAAQQEHQHARVGEGHGGEGQGGPRIVAHHGLEDRPEPAAHGEPLEHGFVDLGGQGHEARPVALQRHDEHDRREDADEAEEDNRRDPAPAPVAVDPGVDHHGGELAQEAGEGVEQQHEEQVVKLHAVLRVHPAVLREEHQAHQHVAAEGLHAAVEEDAPGAQGRGEEQTHVAHGEEAHAVAKAVVGHEAEHEDEQAVAHGVEVAHGQLPRDPLPVREDHRGCHAGHDDQQQDGVQGLFEEIEHLVLDAVRQQVGQRLHASATSPSVMRKNSFSRVSLSVSSSRRITALSWPSIMM